MNFHPQTTKILLTFQLFDHDNADEVYEATADVEGVNDELDEAS